MTSTSGSPADDPATVDRPPADPSAALATLLAGNQRFVAGAPAHPHQDARWRAALAPGQRPFAVLFGCSDSRLAAEIIFDRGLGDLFVVRTAGHVTGTEVLGSIEYAVTVLDTPLVVVLGHDSCGAVSAAVEVARTGQPPDGFIRDVVERVMCSVLAHGARERIELPQAVADHVRYTAELLVRRSAAVADRVADGRCAVVGLTYGLADGLVRQVAAHGLSDSAP